MGLLEHEVALLKLSENIREVFLSETGELTVAEVLERSERRGFGFLLMILTLPIALPFTPPGVSTPFAVMTGLLACQMMARRPQPWFPGWVMKKRVKTGDSRFMQAMRRWAEFFEKFLKPRAQWLYRGGVFQWLVGPIILLASLVMFLPFPLTNSASALAILLIALGLLEEDGAVGLAGVAAAVAGLGLAVVFIVLLAVHGPEGIEIVKRWLGRA